MRFSSCLAIVALLGLGNLLPSASGAPTGLSESRTPLDTLHDLANRADIIIPHEDPDPVIEPEPHPAPPPPPAPPAPKVPGAVTAPKDVPVPVLKTYPPKDVPNPFDASTYTYTKSVRSTPDPNWGTVTDVSTPSYNGGASPVDVIAINTDKNSIGIMEAWNKDDVPADATKKLALADIEMNLFTGAGKTPQDLSLIHVDNVINPDTRNAIVNVYKMNNKPTLNAADITVEASAAAGSTELNGFNTLLGTPFGIGADKVRQQFSVGKSITSFKVSNHKDASGNNVAGQFDMDITFA